MLQELGNALAFILLAGALPLGILFVSKWFRPSYPHAAKSVTYECGELPKGSAYVMFNNRFYLVAIVFLVFDVEVALLFPVLSLFRAELAAGAGAAVFLLSFAFLFVLFIGLIYEWKKGDIDWVRDSSDRRRAFFKSNQERMGASINKEAPAFDASRS